MCGEQKERSASISPFEGSSPRVRGTAEHRSKGSNFQGIIPACAGNSCEAVFVAIYSGDHPRVCGEQLIVRLVNMFVKGSSPRVRGTVIRMYLLAGSKGIIPACAGNRHQRKA